MTIAIVASKAPKDGSRAQRRLQRTLGTLSAYPNTFCVMPQGMTPLDDSLPVKWLEASEGSFERSSALRRCLAGVGIIYCTDFNAAAMLSLSGCRGTIILDPDDMPSLTYQDTTGGLDRDLERLGTLIEREELTLRRCGLVLCANLHVRQFFHRRGLSNEDLIDVANEMPEPASSLSNQDLNHYVYEHTRDQDSRVVYEALQRLQFPWRLSVLTDDKSAKRFWSRDSRVSLVKDDEGWRSTLKAARLVVAGGSISESATVGLSVPRLALWAPHYGVSIVGTENHGWRSCIGGWGLVPPDRPDLLAAQIERYSLDSAFRRQQHDEIVENWQRLDQSQDLLQRQSLWHECTRSQKKRS